MNRGCGAVPERVPVSIGDPALVTGSLMVCGMADVFQCFLQGGRIEIAVSRRGPDRSLWKYQYHGGRGSYDKPKVRLPGQWWCGRDHRSAPQRTLIISRLDRRAFPENVDFITSPGHSYPELAGSTLGMPGAGPQKVITDKGILEVDDGELNLSALYPASPKKVSQGNGWPLRSRQAGEDCPQQEQADAAPGETGSEESLFEIDGRTVGPVVLSINQTTLRSW